MEERRRETLRYLGYGRNEADDTVNALIDECFTELQRTIVPKTVYRAYPLALAAEDQLTIAGIQIVSKKLHKYLHGCHEAVLFAATLGIQTDQLIQKYHKTRISKAVVMQAAATVCIEEYCDQICDVIRQEYELTGCHLKSRFSPGYGDFSLDYQRQLTAVLETGKRIGITLTDSLLMSPSKSVTAVIGVGQSPKTVTSKPGCLNCDKQDCEFRKG